MQSRDATSTAQLEKVSSVPSSSASAMLLSNGTLTQEPSGTAKKRFFFSTSNIRFWTTGRSRKKTPKNKLSNSTADIVNHGDQLRYIKEERQSMRRHLHECLLRNSEHNLQLMRTSCTNEKQSQQERGHSQDIRRQNRDIPGVTIKLRHMSEPNVNMVKDRNEHGRYLQLMSKTNGNFVHQGDNDNYNDNYGNNGIEHNSSNEWEEWMRNQPISVLRLDRTERLVLKIGEGVLYCISI